MKEGEIERLPFDPLSSVLALLKPESYAIRGLDAGGNWSIHFPAAEGIKCYALHSGECWLAMEGERDLVQLVAGDCVLLPRGRAFRLCSDADTTPVDAGTLFTSVSAGQFVTLNGGGACSGLGGYFSFSGLHSMLLLGPLPPIVRLRGEKDQASFRAYLELLMQELSDPQPGSVLMVEHLAQTLLIRALRLHAAEDGKNSAGWLYALQDKRLGAAIGAMHQEPNRKWTLESLASVAGMSRSNFAARFSATVGEPAMEYLTRWRMHLAADGLLNRATPVSVLADSLGYESESAFGAAFKRVMGNSPRQFVANAAMN